MRRAPSRRRSLKPSALHGSLSRSSEPQQDGEMVSFEEAGFKIVSHPNGEPYEGPLNDPPKAEKAD
jgi:hypothetical protein